MVKKISKQAKKLPTDKATKQAELASIMADVATKSQAVIHKFMQQHFSSATTLQHIKSTSNVYQELLQKMLANPTKLAQAQMSYWRDFMQFWRNSTLRWLGQPVTHPVTPKVNDKRFTDVAWEHHPLFSFIKRFYLLTAKHIQEIVNDVDGLDKKTAHQAEFYTNQFINAMSPSNFLITNPEVLRTTVKTNGKNLLQGLQNMLEDLERSKGHFNIKMTDLKAFAVGKNLAVTPGKVIYQNELMQLIQYTPTTKQVYQTPLLMVPPWINKYYILDLGPGNSLVKWLVAQGYTVFMISWINPGAKLAHKDFQDYMLEGPLAALDAITQATGVKQVNALGFCIGGTLLACTLAYMAVKKDQRIQSATYLGTLLDFADSGDMGAFIDDDQIRLLEYQMHKKGYLDGGRMSLTFNMLRANDLIWSYFIKNYLQGQEPFPFDMLYWNADATNMPAKMHSFYLRGMYLHNLLTQPGGIKLGNVPIDLSKIKTPVYFISTRHDHIAPWEATYKGLFMHSGPVHFLLGGSGHIAGIVNPPAKKKYGYFTNDKLVKSAATWLENAKEHEGSWWPEWEKWLQQQSGTKVTARDPVNGKLPIIEAAPGAYAKMKLV